MGRRAERYGQYSAWPGMQRGDAVDGCLGPTGLAALYIERIAEVLDDSSTAKEFAGEYAVKKDLLNKYYWDAEDGFIMT